MRCSPRKSLVVQWHCFESPSPPIVAMLPYGFTLCGIVFDFSIVGGRGDLNPGHLSWNHEDVPVELRGSWPLCDVVIPRANRVRICASLSSFCITVLCIPYYCITIRFREGS